MNPRVSRSSALASQGDRLPDRQDRRQARRRLHARRDPQRHHARDAGLLRADDRLRRHQDPALHLREVPAGERRARPADEVGRRGDGDRPHLQGVAAEGAALARDRQPRLRAARGAPSDDELRGPAARARTPTASGTSATRSGAAWTVERGRGADARSTRGSSATSRRSSPRSSALAGATPRRARRRARSARSSRRASPTSASRALLGTTRGRRSAARRERDGHRARSTRRSTPAAPSSRPTRRTSTRPTSRATTRRGRRDGEKIMILGGGPNRIGQGIEFDYCCVHAALRAARGRLRDHHGQLQPGDRQHRLRHLRQALLRAADARGRAGAHPSASSPTA